MNKPMARVIIYPEKIKTRGYGIMSDPRDLTLFEFNLGYYAHPSGFGGKHVIYPFNDDRYESMIHQIHLNEDEFDLIGDALLVGSYVRVMELPLFVERKYLGQVGQIAMVGDNEILPYKVIFQDDEYWYFSKIHIELVDAPEHPGEKN